MTREDEDLLEKLAGLRGGLLARGEAAAAEIVAAAERRLRRLGAALEAKMVRGRAPGDAGD